MCPAVTWKWLRQSPCLRNKRADLFKFKIFNGIIRRNRLGLDEHSSVHATMTNIFLVYIPLTNHEAVVHYHDTIHGKVALDRIYRYVNPQVRRQLEDILGTRKVAVWGSHDSPANRAKFERMNPGDEILIVEGDT